MHLLILLRKFFRRKASVELSSTSSHLRIDICTSTALLIFTSAHLHLCSPSHLHICTSTFAHLHLCSSSHLRIYISAHLHICTSTSLLIFTSAHLHIYIVTSSHLPIYIFTSPHLQRISHSRTRNAGEIAFWIGPAQPSAEIVRVEGAKCR